MKLLFKKLDPSAIVPAYSMPGDSGLDIRALTDETVGPGDIRVIRTGIAAQPPPGYELQVRPRSGLASRSNVVAVLGTVDNGYRGEIGVILKNFNPRPFHVFAGDKIAQLVPMRVETFDVETVDELDATERGAGGFGSTGRR